jgi:predicted transcriptional regulator
MQLSQIELKTLEQIAQGNNIIKEIARNLNRDKSRLYRIKQELIGKDILRFSNGKLEPKRLTYIVILLQLLSKYPNLVSLLSGSGIPILTALLEFNTIKEIEENTDFEKSIIYRKIKQAILISVVIQTHKKTYALNKKIWNDLIRFLEELKKYDETTDPRIPINSTIYYKANEEIIFSNKSELKAELTGFSAYSQFGIKLLLPTNYYYLPKKPLSKKEIFTHSLYITQKETDIRNLTFIGLFYRKYRGELQKIRHPILDKIKLVLNGKNIEGYPTLEELKDKAEIYDIRL